MVDESASSFAADYLDEVSLRIAFVTTPESAPDEVWEFRFSEPPAGWSERPLIREFEALVQDAPGGPFEFGIRTTRAVYSWGADGAVLTIAAYVALRAADALISLGVDGGVRGLIKKVADRFGDNRRVPDRDEMVGTAQWRASEAYKVVYDTLALVAEEVRNEEQRWEFVFEDETSRYTVEMGVVDGIPLSSRVRRETLSPGS